MNCDSWVFIEWISLFSGNTQNGLGYSAFFLYLSHSNNAALIKREYNSQYYNPLQLSSSLALLHKGYMHSKSKHIRFYTPNKMQHLNAHSLSPITRLTQINRFPWNPERIFCVDHSLWWILQQRGISDVATWNISSMPLLTVFRYHISIMHSSSIHLHEHFCRLENDPLSFCISASYCFRMLTFLCS